MAFLLRRRLCRRFWSQVQENTGSVARDHLANERTFLAWSRTGLGFVGLGIALQTTVPFLSGSSNTSKKLQLELETRVNIASLIFFGTGVMFLGYAIQRYLYITKLLQQGKFCTSVSGALLVSGVSGLTVAVGLFLVCSGNHPESWWNLLKEMHVVDENGVN